MQDSPVPAKVVITPEKALWMSGYGGRTKPAEGKVHDLWAKALALQDGSEFRRREWEWWVARLEEWVRR